MSTSEAGGKKRPQYAGELAQYLVIAEELRAGIDAGDYPPGVRLPYQREIMEQWGASVTTARRAIAELVDLGVVYTVPGVGSYVVQRRIITINATLTEDLGRRKGITAQDSWSTDIRDAGHEPAQRFESINVLAGERAARILGCDPDDPLVMRRCWRTVDGEPTCIEASVFPPWLVRELPRLASPLDIAQGTTSWISDNGYPMVLHTDTVSARPFNAEEAAFLECPPTIGALVRVRVSTDKDGRVLRLTDTTYRSDRHEVVFLVAGSGNHNGENE